MFIEVEDLGSFHGCKKALIPVDSISVIHIAVEDVSTVIRLRDGREIKTFDGYDKIVGQLQKLGQYVPGIADPPGSEPNPRWGVV